MCAVSGGRREGAQTPGEQSRLDSSSSRSGATSGRELRRTHALPRPGACAHDLPCVLHNGVLHGGLHNGVLHGGAGLPSCCSSPASRRFPRGLSLPRVALRLVKLGPHSSTLSAARSLMGSTCAPLYLWMLVSGPLCILVAVGGQLGGCTPTMRASGGCSLLVEHYSRHQRLNALPRVTGS